MRPSTTGVLRWLPIAAATAALASTLFVWRTIARQEHVQTHRTIGSVVRSIRTLIEDQMSGRIDALARMAALLEGASGTDRSTWTSDATLFMDHYPGLGSIERLDLSHETVWSVAAAESGTIAGDAAGAVSSVRGASRHAVLDQCAFRARPTLSHVLWRQPGDPEVYACAPIRAGCGIEPSGFILGTFRVTPLLGSILHSDVARGHGIELRDGARVLFLRDPVPDDHLRAWSEEETLDISGSTWVLRVWPVPALAAASHPRGSSVVLVAGAAMSLLLGAVLHLGRLAHDRARQAETARLQTHAEVERRRRAEQAVRDANAALEARVRDRTAELRRSNEELQQFAYVASHDLQEPLRMIASFSDLLERRYRGRLDADALEFIGFITDGVSRMRDLIDDLLAYSRIGTHGVPPEPTDAASACDEAITNLRVAIEESGARVTRGPLPDVQGDRAQLVRLFQNLIGNAVKFRGARSPEVRIDAIRDDGMWAFAVRDNGIGIDPAHFERIFAIFQRLHGRAEYPGTGVGLAICRKIVERHGGRIWVTSEPGRGSIFFFTLAAAAAEPVAV